jgi:hypothetical protein
MLAEQRTGADDDNDPEIACLPAPRRTRRQRLADRRERGRLEYERRKLDEKCTRCGVSVRGSDDQLCSACRARVNAKKATSAKRLAADRRRKKQCARCGRPSPDRYECIPCLAKLGRAPLATPDPTLDQSHGAIHASRIDPLSLLRRPQVIDAITEGDGRTRTRSRGSGKRGGANQTAFVVDGQDLRYAREALDKAILGMVDSHGPHNAELGRAQKLALRRSWQSLADLARRHLDELLERGGYDEDET